MLMAECEMTTNSKSFTKSASYSLPSWPPGDGAVILIAIGLRDEDYAVIIFQPLQNIGLISEVFIRTIPLTIIALGIAVAYRSGIINIGAEGQMAMGILATTAVALAVPTLPKVILLPLVLLAGIAVARLGRQPRPAEAKLQVSELLPPSC
jgi:simple sugar transport system permease protein